MLLYVRLYLSSRNVGFRGSIGEFLRFLTCYLEIRYG